MAVDNCGESRFQPAREDWSMTDLSRFQHPRFARMYEQISAESERRGTAEHRDRVLTGLMGRVIEIGAGNGLNFGHYPDTVDELVADEPAHPLRVMSETPAHRANRVPRRRRQLRRGRGLVGAVFGARRWWRIGRDAARAQARWRTAVF